MHVPPPHPRPPTSWSRPLFALNFFMADVQAGIGPFLGVFLLGHGWRSGAIGTVMTIGGAAGVLLTAPIGALVDATRRKRLCIVVPGLSAVIASGLALVSQAAVPVALSQVVAGISGAAIGPAVTGLTLGLARQAGFNRQLGLNQAFNHAGNVAGAGLSGLLGWQFGFAAVFWLAAAFAVLAIAAVLLIPAAAIDHDAARGLHHQGTVEDRVSGLSVLAESRPLLILATALFAFHLGNAAMLPLYGLAVVSAGNANPAGFVAVTIVVAQAVMVPASLVAMRMVDRRGTFVAMLVSFAVLPVRGVLAAHLLTPWGVYPVQILDGIGAGLQSVAVPVLVARILDGTGRVNVGQGAVMTAQGIGAALSPALGGWIAQEIGYPAMFLTLGGCALGSVALWLGCAPLLRQACSGDADAPRPPLAALAP